MTSIQQQKSAKIITNKITALFMGTTDLWTGKWFPWKKMTWETKKDTNYLNCSIAFVEGAKAFRTLYPKSVNVVDYGAVRHYPDISYCPWRNRIPMARPLEQRDRRIFGYSPNEKIDPVEFAAVSGGYRHGDKDYLFPELAPDNGGNYNYVFPGIDGWYMPSSNRPELEAIPVGTKVTLMLPQKWSIERGEWKEYTPPPEAIRMPMFAEGLKVGYAPQYIKDLYLKFGDSLQVEIYRKNKGLPFDYQFLFKATINQAVGIPFDETKYQTFTTDS